MSRERRKLSPRKRLAVVLRDGGFCGLCGEPVLRPEDLEIDHVLPIFQGGSDDLENLRTAHVDCNQARTYVELNGWDRRSWDDDAATNTELEA